MDSVRPFNRNQPPPPVLRTIRRRAVTPATNAEAEIMRAFNRNVSGLITIDQAVMEMRAALVSLQAARCEACHGCGIMIFPVSICPVCNGTGIKPVDR